jgi:serine/threonine-protein kinase HipA
MYLDPKGITRQARWYHRETRKDLRHWKDILEHLALFDHEHLQVVDALVRCGERLATLPDSMREAGVDNDIVEFVIPSVEA